MTWLILSHFIIPGADAGFGVYLKFFSGNSVLVTFDINEEAISKYMYFIFLFSSQEVEVLLSTWRPGH